MFFGKFEQKLVRYSVPRFSRKHRTSILPDTDFSNVILFSFLQTSRGHRFTCNTTLYWQTNSIAVAVGAMHRRRRRINLPELDTDLPRLIEDDDGSNSDHRVDSDNTPILDIGDGDDSDDDSTLPSMAALLGHVNNNVIGDDTPRHPPREVNVATEGDEECCICYDKPAQVRTNCVHYMCLKVTPLLYAIYFATIDFPKKILTIRLYILITI